MAAHELEGSTRFTITRETCPELTLPTDRLVASGFGSDDPFVETVPPGAYRAALFTSNLAELEDDGSTVKFDFDSVAAPQITILDSPVATSISHLLAKALTAGGAASASAEL